MDRKTPRLTPAAAGFTLIEVLVAIVILATGLVAVLGAMSSTEQAARISGNLVTTAILAENSLAETRMELLTYHELHSGSEQNRVRIPGREYEISRRIGPYTHPSILDETRLNHVEVQVKWREGARASDLRLASIFLNEDKKEVVS